MKGNGREKTVSEREMKGGARDGYTTWEEKQRRVDRSQEWRGKEGRGELVSD